MTATSFLGIPRCDGPEALAGCAARAALIGAGTASPYRGAGAHAAQAPGAIRAAAAPLAARRGHLNLDLGLDRGAPGLAEGAVLDCGDLALDPADGAGNRLRIRHAIAATLGSGAVPVVLGGDASVLIPLLQGFEGHGPVNVLQVGAELGWREQIEGERWGAASAMRRASEMAHVARLVQIGARGLGATRPEEIAAARAAGAHLLPAAELARSGPESGLAALPAGGAVHLALSCDGLDPSIMPAVPARLAGGLGYWALLDLIAAAARRGRIAGVSLTDLTPDRDIHGLGAGTAVQLIAATLGLIAA